MSTAALQVEGLTKYFRAGSGLSERSRVHAVDDVSFELRPGTITALVGGSGSGKSTVARLLARLYEPTSGRVVFEGRDLALTRKRSELLRYRAQVQMTFQDPFDSLNPAKTVHHHLERPLRIHKIVPARDIEDRINSLLERVGLAPPQNFAPKYPHELSGGQRQRVSIARSLAVEPRVLVADEPISMLDVSIRIGVLNLMTELKEHGLAILYVTHDLASARYVADDVLVMHAGQIVEQGPADDVLTNPLHPYTQLLIDSVPDPTRGERPDIDIPKGSAGAAIDPGDACRFLARCPLAVDVCSRRAPVLVEAHPRHSARCHVTAPSPDLREDLP